MDVEQLEVYKRAIALIEPVDRLASLIERQNRDQARDLRKTARQIAPSIAEGFAKKESQKDFKRFIGISMGSSDEMITHLRQAKKSKFSGTKVETFDALIRHYKILSKQLNQLHTTLKQNLKSDL